MRKNSLGLDGAVCIAAIIYRHKGLESLAINDNDLGPEGGEIIGLALKHNSKIKELKMAQNGLKSEGTIHILKNALNLETLNLSKNKVSSDVGKYLFKLLQTSKVIKHLNLDFNELMVVGTKFLA